MYKKYTKKITGTVVFGFLLISVILGGLSYAQAKYVEAVKSINLDGFVSEVNSDYFIIYKGGIDELKVYVNEHTKFAGNTSFSDLMPTDWIRLEAKIDNGITFANVVHIDNKCGYGKAGKPILVNCAKVTEIGDNKIKVQSNATEIEFYITAFTKFVKTTYATLSVGDTVLIVGTDSGSAFLAKVITKRTGNSCNSKEECITNSITLRGVEDSIFWDIDGCSKKGFKVVWSKNSNPTYPTRNGDQYHYFSSPDANTDSLYPFNGSGVYYVRVCEYLGGKCGVYSNEIMLQLGSGDSGPAPTAQAPQPQQPAQEEEEGQDEGEEPAEQPAEEQPEAPQPEQQPAQEEEEGQDEGEEPAEQPAEEQPEAPQPEQQPAQEEEEGQDEGEEPAEQPEQQSQEEEEGQDDGDEPAENPAEEQPEVPQPEAPQTEQPAQE